MEAAVAASAGQLYWEDGLVCRRDAEPGGQGVYVLPSFDPLLVECLQDIQDALRHEVYTAGGAE